MVSKCQLVVESPLFFINNAKNTNASLSLNSEQSQVSINLGDTYSTRNVAHIHTNTLIFKYSKTITSSCEIMDLKS